MSGGVNDIHFRRPCGWTKQTILYEVGFRVALLGLLGILSSVIFFASGVLGGSFDSTLALLSTGG